MTETMKENLIWAYNRYCKSSMTSLWHAYDNPSNAKARIWFNIGKKYTNPRIIGYNCMFFSVGALKDDEFYFITHQHDYHAKVSEIESWIEERKQAYKQTKLA
mgnify:CR=1 FL=1